MHSVESVIKHFGGVTKLARALGCASQAISQWKRLQTIPEGRAYQIQVLSKGRFKTSELPVRKRWLSDPPAISINS